MDTPERRLRAALYARVSTQNHHQDPEVQLRELREYCQRKGWDITGEYVDHGISGTKESRPELNRLMSDAADQKFDVVLVWKFDRFARSVPHLLKALETFQSQGIAFVAATEGIDTSTPTGRMVLIVVGAVAELERNLITERIRAGLRKAKAKGTKSGRAIGHPRAKDFDVNEVRQRIFLGERQQDIADELGVSRTLIIKRLNEVKP
jgi:DNA invertase Pin-like site-specific DNA recombinase